MSAARPPALSPRRPRRPRRPRKPRRTPVSPKAGASSPAQVAGVRGQISQPERQLGLFGSESGIEVAARVEGRGVVAHAVLEAEGAGQRQAIPAEHDSQKPTCGENKNINPEAAAQIPVNINTKNRPARYAEFRLSPRVILHAGDRIRVSAGPYYVSRDAAGNVVKTKMAEKGVMVFSSYCELGTSQWIEARGKAGFAALHIGPEENSSEIPGLVRRPYRVTKLRPSKTLPKARLPKGAQR